VALKFQGKGLSKIQGLWASWSNSFVKAKAFDAALNDTSRPRISIPGIPGEHKK